MTTIRARTVIGPFLVGSLATLAILLATYALAAADAGGGGDLAPIDDAFTAGRRSGFLWIVLGLAIAAALQEVGARLKPSDGTKPKPGSWRAKLSIAVGGGFAVTAALVDMFASSRGLTPITTAAFGAVALYYGAKDDPERGSKRAPDEEPAP